MHGPVPDHGRQGSPGWGRGNPAIARSQTTVAATPRRAARNAPRSERAKLGTKATDRYPSGVGARSTEPRACSVTGVLTIVGNEYSLQVIREIAYGCSRFAELLPPIGCSRDTLAARPKKLEGLGVIRRPRYSRRPPRYEHEITRSGADLGPTVLSLKEWGDRYLNNGGQPVIFAHGCGAEFHARIVCAGCGQEPVAGELRVPGGTSAVLDTRW
jgi:DNA-binding HxlR family transcriptional regulator